MSSQVDLNVCRVCTKSSRGKSFTDNEDAIKKFEYVTNLKVLQKDGMPTIMCNICFIRLKVAYEFKCLAISSNQHFQDFVDKINEEFEASVKKISQDGFEILHEAEIEVLFKDDSELQSQGIVLSEANESIVDNQENLEEFLNGILLDIPIIQEVKVLEPIDLNLNLNIDQIISNIDSNIDSNIVSNIDSNIDSNIVSNIDSNIDLNIDLNIDSNSISKPEIIPDEIVFLKNGEECENIFDMTELTMTTKIVRPRRKKRLFCCNVCTSTFATKSNLLRHMIAHNEKKPFNCEICGNGFTQSGSLKVHMLIHSGEKPHVCSICSRGFTQSKTLTAHMRRHTGEKPYKCLRCHTTFRQRDLLKRHMEKDHNGKDIYTCTVCHRKLETFDTLEMHMKLHEVLNEDEEKPLENISQTDETGIEIMTN